MTPSDKGNFDDNDFLQDWLEKRYGCGFAQRVIDDLQGKEEAAQALYEVEESSMANDNGLLAVQASEPRKAP